MSIRLDASRAAVSLESPSCDAWRTRCSEGLDALLAARPGYLRIVGDDELVDATLASLDGFAEGAPVVLLGIGGSGLGARTLKEAFPDHRKHPLTVVDNVDPRTLEAVNVTPDTRFLVISKSGSTAETVAQMLFFRSRLEALGVDDLDGRFLFITDPEKGPLRALAGERGIATLPVPQDVGGRFSVLTPVGLLPAALLGIDIRELVAGARSLATQLAQDGPARRTLIEVAALHCAHALDREIPIQVLFSYCDRLAIFGDWFAQLWGESLGKRLAIDGSIVNRGSTPLAAVGATDQHSLVQLFAEGPDDKQYWFLTVEDLAGEAAIPESHANLHPDFSYLGGRTVAELFRAEQEGTLEALVARGRPVSELRIDRLDARHLGALFLFFEALTSVAGHAYGVDPYDQPGVEGGKILAFDRMGREGYAEKARELLASTPGVKSSVAGAAGLEISLS